MAAIADIAIGAYQIEAFGVRAVALMYGQFGIQQDRGDWRVAGWYSAACRHQISGDLLPIAGVDGLGQCGEALPGFGGVPRVGQQQEGMLCAAQCFKEPSACFVGAQQWASVRRAITGTWPANQMAVAEGMEVF